MSDPIFSLDIRRARKGDCLLLHYGTASAPGLMLIDGGPSGVFGPELKPRLQEIRTHRGLASNASLPVDVGMVSHIDDDHIKGILDLTKELVEAQGPRLLKFATFWHNSFDDIIGNDPQHLLSSVTASFGVASLAALPEAADDESIDHHSAFVLASVAQGNRLRDDLRALHVPLNKPFTGKLIMADQGDAVDLGKGLSVVVAGPMKDELADLQAEHDKFLKAEAKKEHPAVPASFTDTSVANLSSIVVLAKVGDKSILLTGDARGDKILLGMEQTGLIAAGGNLHIDILKVPHHGSDRNMETGFFKRVTADHYVFSGNGEHGNPERATLEMLLAARGAAKFTVHLTYPLDEIDKGRKEDWEKEQNKEKTKKLTKPGTIVRPDWSDEVNSLKAFLAANEAFAKKIKFVEKGKPHVIDLLEPLGF